jgi:4-carboxymuconolactone decarboxylase
MTLAHRTAAARVLPLEAEHWHPLVQEILTRGKPVEFGAQQQPVFNIFKTLANYPNLMKRLAPWGNHVLFKSSLPPREREILILRTGWLCQAVYEWGHHEEIGLNTAGLTESDIRMIKAGPQAQGISAEDADLLLAADMLVRDHFIDDALWSRLSARFSLEQQFDLVFAVGHYTMMCMALNSFGVQLETAGT